jgi:hypothetical protein
VQRYVKGLLPDLTISVGIGRHKKDPALLPDAYSEAGVALEIGHRIHGPSSVSTFEGTGTYKLLFRVLQENPRSSRPSTPRPWSPWSSTTRATARSWCRP